MRSIALIGAALTLASAGGAGSAAATARATDEAAIRDLEAAWVVAIRAKDLDKIVSLYATDGSLLASGAPIANGTAAIEASWQHILAAPGLDLIFTPTQIVVAKARDMALDLGTFKLTVVGAQGKSEVTVGKYVVVWKRQPGGMWRVAADIFNSDH
jgi:uncharacterized protein (TIGR02246 family)